MISRKQEEEFASDVLPVRDLVHNAIEWIKENLAPEEVFNDKELEQWAIENGYTREDD